MGSYEIPKEIKSKPKIMGLEMKELVILLLGFFSIFTVLKDMVHGMFVVPFIIVATGLLLWAVMPSKNNPSLKNYMSIVLFFKRDKQTCHPIDVHIYENSRLSEYREDFAYTRSIEKMVEKTESTSKLAEEEIDVLPVISREKVNEENELPLELEEETSNKEDTLTLVQEEVPKEISVEEEYEQITEESSGKLNELKGKIKNKKEQNDRNIANGMVSNANNAGTEKEDAEIDVDIPNMDMEVSLKTPKEKRFNFKKTGAFVIASLLVVTIGIAMLSDSILNYSAEITGNKEQEEALVEALRSSSLQYYDEAIVYFDKIDYYSLEDDDKDAMLLAYLFADKSEVAIELEPAFSETVVSYYKATHDMQKIKDVGKIVESDVVDFEVAVSDKDYETIIELKDKVKMKEDRQEKVVEAYLSLDDVVGANDFVATVDNENLMMDIKRYEEKKKAEKKRKKNKK